MEPPPQLGKLRLSPRSRRLSGAKINRAAGGEKTETLIETTGAFGEAIKTVISFGEPDFGDGGPVGEMDFPKRVEI